MLTIEDCIAFCALTEAEVDAIAEHEHEHVPEIVAAEMANYLIHTADGAPRIRRMIVDDIEHARVHGDHAHMAQLVHVLRHFIAAHDEQTRTRPQEKRLPC